LNSRLLGSVLIGAILGALVAHGIIGPQPSFSLAAIGEPSWHSYLLVPLVAVAGTLVGVAFQKSALGLRARQRKWSAVPASQQWIAGAARVKRIRLSVVLVTWAFGFEAMVIHSVILMVQAPVGSKSS
jgi:CIC family chloride channel protein